MYIVVAIVVAASVTVRSSCCLVVNVQKSEHVVFYFYHFDFEICSAPQRALFRHFSFQKFSEREVLVTF